MKKELFIVGAGISGLYLASLLEDYYEITILEARDRIGGRVFSIDGHDMGPSWIWSHHKQMLGLLNSLGIKVFEQYNNGCALYDTKDKVELFNPQPSPVSLRVDGTLSLLIDKLYQNLKRTKIILNERVEFLNNLDDMVDIKTNKSIYKADKVIVTLPPRLAAHLEYKPELSPKERLKLTQTQTWMGNSAKCVVTFHTSFWRDKNLSGFVFSNQGPLSEIHDASTKDEAALFGFLSSSADMKNLEQNVLSQLERIFSITKDDIRSIYFVDWREENLTATKDDARPLREHPSYGIDIEHFNGKILFSATEYSYEEGGYLEGALIRANQIAESL
ncbi:MAG: monoamine oxidase [Sulfurimonas sp.]|jgi:monoamine oxidase|uniref:flavin monoamine oxidase family protein n=1 Tax=Sulfurimonas sp. TaxID=2022749 RepID=UPI0039E31B3E